MERLQRICAVEPRENGSALLYIRTKQGAVEHRDISFRPFLLTAFNAFPPDLPGVRTESLSGDGDLRWLVSFPDMNAYEQGVDLLKKSTGFAAGQPNAPYRLFSDLTQQVLIQNELRLFEGMTFPEIRRMQFDIETLCTPGYEFPNPKRADDSIIIISHSDSTGWEIDIRL